MGRAPLAHSMSMAALVTRTQPCEAGYGGTRDEQELAAQIDLDDPPRRAGRPRPGRPVERGHRDRSRDAVPGQAGRLLKRGDGVCGAGAEAAVHAAEPEAQRNQSPLQGQHGRSGVAPAKDAGGGRWRARRVGHGGDGRRTRRDGRAGRHCREAGRHGRSRRDRHGRRTALGGRRRRRRRWPARWAGVEHRRSFARARAPGPGLWKRRWLNRPLAHAATAYQSTRARPNRAPWRAPPRQSAQHLNAPGIGTPGI
jgi:hypothetical protein